MIKNTGTSGKQKVNSNFTEKSNTTPFISPVWVLAAMLGAVTSVSLPITRSKNLMQEKIILLLNRRVEIKIITSSSLSVVFFRFHCKVQNWIQTIVFSRFPH